MILKVKKGGYFTLIDEDGNKYFKCCGEIISKVVKKTGKIIIIDDYRKSDNTFRYLLDFLEIDTPEKLNNFIRDGEFSFVEEIEVGEVDQ